MKNKLTAFLAGVAIAASLLFLTAPVAKADVFEVLTFPGFNDGTHFVGPELGRLNGGTPFTIQCIDISHTISIPTTYNVTVFNLNGDLTGLRFYDGTNTDSFLKAAFLFQLGMASAQDVTTQSNIQRAIWGLFPHAVGNDPYLNTPGALAFVALANAGILDGSFLSEVAAGQFQFYSPSAGGLADAPGQLFIGQVPEASTYAYIVIGFVGLVGINRMRQRARINVHTATI
jgi:hypothetical protein